MRRLPIVLALVACGSKNSEEPAKSAPAPAPAKPVDAAIAKAVDAAAAAPKCWGPSLSGTLTAFAADDNSATLCMDIKDPEHDDKPPAHSCHAVDFATGAFRDAAEPSKVADAVTFKYDDGQASACLGAGACVKLDLPKLPKSDPPAQYTLHASQDGKKLVALGQDIKGIQLLDATTGKRTKAITYKVPEGGCLEDAYPVGDLIFVDVSVCAGPGGAGHFLRDGKEVAKMDEAFNIYGAAPLWLDGDRWAFTGWGGGDFQIWDVKAAKLLTAVALPPLENCDADCSLFDTTTLATPTLVKTPAGKLVTVDPQSVTLVDETGKPVKRVRFPVCPAKS